MSESTSLAVPFNKSKQRAVLGHLLSNRNFFMQCRSQIKPEWFNEEALTKKVYEMQLALFEKHGRIPTVPELEGCPEVMAMPPLEASKLQNHIKCCLAEMTNYGLDMIRAELTEWLRAVIFASAITSAKNAYNKGNFNLVENIFHDVAKKVKDVRFDDFGQVTFEDPEADFKMMETEKAEALTTGLHVLDRALLEGATQGGLKKKDTTLLLAPSNVGKCHGYGTLIMMADGSLRPVQEIVCGDKLMGPDGQPRTVLGTTKGYGPLYRISPKSGGDSWVCNDVHVLSLKPGKNEHRYRKGDIHNIPLDQYLQKSNNYKKIMRLWRAELAFAPKELPMAPYLLGVWLGDGHAARAAVTSMDPKILEAWESWVRDLGDDVSLYRQDKNRAITVAAVASEHNGTVNSNAVLRNLGVLENKHIPHDYLTSSREQRLELLAGLVDTNGHSSGRAVQIIQKRELLAQNIAYLARSLGFKASVVAKTKRCQTGAEGTYYEVTIQGALSQIPTRLERKVARDTKKDPLLTGFDVEYIGEGDYYGFELDGDHLYLLGDFTVTHNTTAMITMATHNVKRGKSVLFMTHEGAPEDIKRKLWCAMMERPYNELVGMYSTEEGYKKIQLARLYMNQFLTYIPYNKPGMTVEQVEPVIRRAQEERMAKNNGQGYDLLVVDYPAKLFTERAGKGNMPRREIDRVVYDYYVQLALEYGFHSLLAIQTNRDGSKINNGKEDRLLTMEDVSESWGVMEMASNVISINRSPLAKARNRVTFYVAKSRSSETGTAVVCNSRYDCSLTHHEKFGATWYRDQRTMEDRIDDLLLQYKGQMIPESLLF